MNDFNHTAVTGRLTKDAELTTTVNGNKVANFVIATNHGKKNSNGEYEEQVSFIPLSYFYSSDKFAEYLKKGQSVTVEGYLEQSRWEKDGQMHSQLRLKPRTIYIHFAKNTSAMLRSNDIGVDNESTVSDTSTYEEDLF